MLPCMKCKTRKIDLAVCIEATIQPMLLGLEKIEWAA